MSEFSPVIPDCFEAISQPFLLCVTVHKARHLKLLNEDTFVLVSCNGKHYRTKTFRNSDCPFFNEYFVFEIFTTKKQLFRLNLQLAVVHHRCISRKNQIIGEFTIGLKTIWDNPSHAYIQKWATLEDPDTNESDIGFLQVDLSLLANFQRPQPVTMPFIDSDIIDQNLLMPVADDNNLQRVNYSVKICSGEFALKADYAIQVTYGGIRSRTKMLPPGNNPRWDENLAFVGTFPSLCQLFIFDIIINGCCQKRIYASVDLPFTSLSKKIDGIYSLPTFGPGYLYFYRGHRNYSYVGRVLLSISTEILHNRRASPTKYPSVPIQPSLETALFWTEESFVLNLLLLNVIVLDRSKPSKIEISLDFLNQTSGHIEIKLDKHPISKTRYAPFHEFPPKRRPILTVRFKCPDFRWKYVLHQSLHHCWLTGRASLERFELFQMCSGRDQIGQSTVVIRRILNELDNNLKQISINFKVTTNHRLTDWDKKWMLYALERMKNILSNIGNLKESLKDESPNISQIYRETIDIFGMLEKLMHEEQNVFPEGFLFIWSVGGNVTKFVKGCSSACNQSHADALCRLKAIKHLHRMTPTPKVTRGDGIRPVVRRTSILARPFCCSHSCKTELCGCVYAKLDVAIWVGPEREQPAEWSTKNQPVAQMGNQATVRPHLVPCEEKNVPIRSYVSVYQGKIHAGTNARGLSDPKMVVLLENHEMTTSTINRTLSPRWNETIIFSNIKLLENSSLFICDELVAVLMLLEENEKDLFQKPDEPLGLGLIRSPIHPPGTLEAVLPDYFTEIFQQCSIINKQQVRVKGPTGNKDNKLTIQPLLAGEPTSNNDLWKEFDDRRDLVLRWVGLHRNGNQIADVLMSVHTEQDNQHHQQTAEMKVVQGIPNAITPSLEEFTIFVVFAGLRGFGKSIHLITTGRYRVQLVLGELKLTSGLSRRQSGRSINFLDVFSSATLTLPSQFEYWPPLIVQHVDCSRTKTLAVVGTNVIHNPQLLFCDHDVSGELLFHKSTMLLKRQQQISIDTLDKPKKNKTIKTPARKCNKLKQKLIPIINLLWESLETRRAANDRKHPESTGRRISHESEYSWWTKFYNSCSSNPSELRHRLKIFDCELEAVPEFEKFHDWSKPIPLFSVLENISGYPLPYTKLKCKILIRTNQKSNSVSKIAMDSRSNILLRSIPTIMADTKLTIVVYIVQGLNLRSRDMFGLSDPYVKLEYGKNKLSDRPNYVKNQTNPVFGKRFVMQGQLPRDQILTIAVVDHDICTADDLIGVTKIDIEDRTRSSHFLNLGLPFEYSSLGYNAWRHPKKPSKILEELCQNYGLTHPVYVGQSIQLANLTFNDDTLVSTDEDLHERLALVGLKNFHKIPLVGSHFVPEHVESRPLYHDDHPGIEQGKLQMWIEIYPSTVEPVLIDITPLPPKAYELRLIVWNTADVILDESNIFGTKMSDIYIKCWLNEVDEAQFTDIHYRSLDGTANFNWRMIFPLYYSPSEAMMVVKRKKSFYEQLDTEEKMPPMLTVQAWDNDLLTRDDFLGTLNLNLAQLPKPVPKAINCVHRPLTTPGNTREEYLNLFREGKVRGWYPLVGKVNDKIAQTGKIELELQLLTEEDAFARPAGKGRKPPQRLPVPERPTSSFNWHRHPLKSFQMIVRPNVRRACLSILVLGFVVLGCYALISAVPMSIITKALARKASLDRIVQTGVDAPEQEDN
ncbi:fer-1-like protein 6 [Uranotaenia lowii]|uniref:fer-1-like protein 6 n=1 Tax=Uranotaenia lowii TaxID=190385 RepID=UPI00247ADBA6|nr:fer-1-like protein 6 [Uranotaenia lowii]